MDPVETFESDRRFQVWLYSVSHAQLLLRSVKTAAFASRIDILFKAVELMDIPTAFNGLQIERSGGSYRLSGEGWQGRVVAAACFAAEDQGEYHDPSAFADSLP